MKTDPNAPAFPLHLQDASQADWMVKKGYAGLTIREEFAKSQMAALTVAYADQLPIVGRPLGADWLVLRRWLADLALEQADALLAELNKES